MKIIISPAKKMQRNTNMMEPKGTPVFMEQTEYLLDYLRSLSYEEAKRLWNCSDQIAQLNYERLKEMELTSHLTPALLSYQGLQYQHMAPAVLEDGQWEYVQEHVYILSGFYGLVHPLDGVVPYRLEMQAKVQIPGKKNLYDYWGKRLYEKVTESTDVVLNLASKEYSRCIEKYLDSRVKFVTCMFGEYKNGKIIEKGTYAKMARGEMVRYMAENHIRDAEGVKEFRSLGFVYEEEASGEDRIVFVRKDLERNCE